MVVLSCGKIYAQNTSKLKRTFNHFIIYKIHIAWNQNIALDEESICSISTSHPNIMEMKRSYCDDRKSLIAILETRKPIYIQLDFEPDHMIETKNKNILLSSYSGRFLALFDSEFKFIRKITEINNEELNPWAIACDESGNIYVTNDGNSSLNKLDSELNLLKSIIDDDDMFTDFTIYKNNIYACMNKSIQVYCLDLNKVCEFIVKGNPDHIKIGNNTACICFETKTENDVYSYSTRFYKLPSFELLIEHNVKGPILVHNSMFHVYNWPNLIVFDINGNLAGKIDIFLNETVNGCVGLNKSFCYFSNNFHLCLKDKRFCKI
jgi:hypothetical protein